MAQRWIEDVIEEYADSLRRNFGYEVYRFEPPSLLFLCLRSTCLVVFFCAASGELGIELFVRRVEDEIREWRDKNDWRRLDLNLVLFVPEATDAEIASNIRVDRTLCRKFVVKASQPSEAKTQLSYLPFSPMDTEASAPLRVLSLQPEVLLRKSGASEDFARDIVAHTPGVKVLAEKAIQDEYRLLARESEQQPDMELVEGSDRPQGAYAVSVDEVALKNFRGIGTELKLSLGQNITVVYGINGTGKTSFCDAIEWAVTGSVSRIGSDRDARKDETERSIVNYFAETGETFVQLALSGGGQQLVRRSMDNSLSQDVNSSSGNNDWGALLAATLAERRPGLDLRRARDAFRSCHLLEQSTIREFLEKDPAERFEALSRILGYEEIVRLGKKIDGVRELIADELRTRESFREDARAQVQFAQSRVDSIQAARGGQPGSSEQPTAQILAELKSALRELGLPEFPLRDDATPDDGLEWLARTLDALSAFHKSLDVSSTRTTELLNLSGQVVLESEESKELLSKVAAVELERQAGAARTSETQTTLARERSDLERLRTQLAVLRTEENALRWTSSNRLVLKQEEERLNTAKEELLQSNIEAGQQRNAVGETEEHAQILLKQLTDAQAA